ncbi:tRNA pseudouridine(38-40) synthase TruA [Flavobacterium sp. MAH-1]|uniref:tRNA pseudouridine synthase A n=1 Tax=Flavobacterium agri TaxID=2743471 RepID=A0A7Y8XZ64_9FLAO|nr:tRNA pseudouridine(38-40) synthase TruA [Flavobacterium agri]NUY79401.1 tRNA pseudouridine(38-40) synthase TruA [Flavobacterium agri]NYA69426.1 tRNA pseudouridine(38-40) synthase TruA [Flavobacterium agri]
MRYFLEFSYNGTNYHGWQSQPNAVSVQETINKSLSLLLGETIDVVGAGRTDTGVHASQMFAHFDYEGWFETSQLRHKLNSFLPKDIAIHDIIPVHDDAHTRFDAKKRTYEYHIHTKKDVFLEGLSWYQHHQLDVDKMNEAAKILFEHTDFECFSKTGSDVGTFNCQIFRADWKQHDHRLIFTVAADRFLRNMVRAIVGTLINVGLHKVDLEGFNAIIVSKNRGNAGFSVPAHGLYLTKVEYDYIKPQRF